MTGTPHLPRTSRPTTTEMVIKSQSGPISPGQKMALRVMIDEVRDEEMRIARLRHQVALVRTGVHPRQVEIEALLAWGFALHDNYGPGSHAQSTDKEP